MDMGNNNAMMTPYFHFLGGDYLFFKAWQPASRGAIAGACIGLLALALFERWLSAAGSILEAHWRKSNSTFVSQSSTQPLLDQTLEDSPAPSTFGPQPEHKPSKPRRILPSRTIPPFITKIDVPRGFLYAIQRLLGYMLMLAIMTYQASYIISILAGLVIGEAIFGRMATSGRKDHH